MPPCRARQRKRCGKQFYIDENEVDFGNAGYVEDSYDKFAKETQDMLFQAGWKKEVRRGNKQSGGGSLLAWGSVHAGDPPGGPPR